MEGKIANLESRLDFANREITKLTKEKNQAIEQMRNENAEKEELKIKLIRKDLESDIAEFQQLNLHIACKNGILMDEVLLYDMENTEEMECYEASEEGVKCHHIVVTRRGKKVTPRKWNIKKRRCCAGEESVAQRPRIN